MPRKFVLTWQAGATGRTGRWRKKYQGKSYYFDGGSGKFDRDAYDAAVKAWEAQKVKLDAAAARPHRIEHEAAVAEWEQVLAWSSQHADHAMAEQAARTIASIRSRLEAPYLEPLPREQKFDAVFDLPLIKLPSTLSSDVAAALAQGGITFNTPARLSLADRERISAELDGSPSRIAREVWQDRLAVQARRSAVTEDSVQAHVARFIKQREQRADAKDIAVGRVYALGLHLTHFQDWLGKDCAVREINGDVLLRYHTALLDNVRAKKWKRPTAHHYLGSVKTFVRWLWQTESIPSLPRVLDAGSDLLKINKPLAQIVIFTLAEISQLMSEASSRTKLYILLMLNCGMTQKDISDLLKPEVDWAAGRITRKRSKTSSCESVPTVSYLLWPETLQLLREHCHPDSPDRVLVNSNGTPLWVEELGEGGKLKKLDNIKNAFDRLRSNVAIKKPLKSLKKTSASLLSDNERFRGLEDLFLGHAPKKMSERHYAQAPEGLLDQAIEWLRSKYGLALDGRLPVAESGLTGEVVN